MMRKYKLIFIIIVMVLCLVQVFSSCKKRETNKSDVTNNKEVETPAPAYTFDETDDRFIFMGEYPQTLSNLTAEEVKTGKLDQLTGWYEYQNNKYAIVKATPNDLASEFVDNVTEIERGKEYVFLVEPIRWRIIQKYTNRYLLLCDKAIDSTSFTNADKFNTKDYLVDKNVYASHYAISDLRERFKWIDNVAFSVQAREAIIRVDLDNCETNYDRSIYAIYQENTSDRTFALSYQDMFNPTNKVYFDAGEDINKNNRIKHTTDYALARGVMKIGSDSKTSYLLRSAGNDKSKVCYVSSTGAIKYDMYVAANFMGVCPAVFVKII